MAERYTSGRDDDAYWIDNLVCGKKNEDSPYEISSNLQVYNETTTNSKGDVIVDPDTLTADIHTSCSYPLFIGLKVGPDSNANINGCPGYTPPATVFDCDPSVPPLNLEVNFEIIGGCFTAGKSGVFKVDDYCDGYIKQEWPLATKSEAAEAASDAVLPPWGNSTRALRGSEP